MGLTVSDCRVKPVKNQIVETQQHESSSRLWQVVGAVGHDVLGTNEGLHCSSMNLEKHNFEKPGQQRGIVSVGNVLSSYSETKFRLNVSALAPAAVGMFKIKWAIGLCYAKPL